jgi:uncharacterized protein (TIGR02271 family)
MSTGYDSTTTHQDLTSLIGHHVYDAEGNKIGTAGTIYQSDETGAPEWITVKTGLFGTKESFVPLHGAEADDKGLHVAVRKDEVKDAPRIDEDGHLSDAETAELYRHYGLTPGRAARGGGQAGTGSGTVPPQRMETGRDAARRTPADMRREAAARSGYVGTGREASAQPAEGDDRSRSVLRSEERLRAGTETVEAGRVRLRKHVVTSQEQITVPVRREELRVTREPIKPGEARTGATIGEEEREVILHEERPVVAKETVPVERVSLDTETVQENREVNETVRREEVEIEDGRKRPRG